MKIVKKIALVLFVLGLPLLLFTTSISTAVNSVWLYKYGFARYGVSETTGITGAELDKAARGLISYWNSGDEEINVTVIKDGQPFTLFNAREVGHLVDVKALIHLGYKCLLGSFIYALLFAALALFWWKDKRLLATGLVWGSGFSLLVISIVGVASLIDFQWLFWQFHLLSFTNDLWLLDPRIDYLIMLFPEGFWFDAAIICVALMALLAVILGFVGWRILKKPRSI
jgi:integral membrane protein (TIGR01906 family)